MTQGLKKNHLKIIYEFSKLCTKVNKTVKCGVLSENKSFRKRAQIILVSMCLVGVNCNYKGESKPNQKVIELMKMGKAIPVCPEQLGGLPTPRVACHMIYRAIE